MYELFELESILFTFCYNIDLFEDDEIKIIYYEKSGRIKIFYKKNKKNEVEEIDEKLREKIKQNLNVIYSNVLEALTFRIGLLNHMKDQVEEIVRSKK